MSVKLVDILTEKSKKSMRYWYFVFGYGWAGALVQRLKLPAWKVGDRGFVPRAGIHLSKKQNDVSSPLTRKDSILWGASVTEMYRARPQTARARISNTVFGGQCHLIHLTILKRLFCPVKPTCKCAQMWPKTTFISFHLWDRKSKSGNKLKSFFRQPI